MARLALSLLLLYVPIAQAASPPAPAGNTVAHIKLSGSFSEQAPASDPLGSSLIETLKQKLDRLKKAAADKEVHSILLEVNGVSAGWGQVHEVAAAISRARASGKKVHAFLESGDLKDYAIALACDDIALPEASWLMLTGLRAEVTFYKKLLEMAGVKADFVMMGDFKSAAEPYLRDSLSEANRKQITEMLDDFFENEVVGRIARGRKLSPDKVKKLIDQGPYSARSALKNGLVDRLYDMEDLVTHLKKNGTGAPHKLVRDYGKKKEEEMSVATLYSRLLFGGSGIKFKSKDPKVAVIYATGSIVTGKGGSSLFGGESMGSETMVKAIREAAEDSTVKAIVLRIDSPGGSALASDLMWRELKRCKKPVIASMGDVAASGGYYIAMAANKIYAEPGTITGSIGVIGGKLAMKGLWDKVGITSEVISRGENAGIFSDEPFTEGQKKAFKTMMEDIYDQFVDKALAGRKGAGKKMDRDTLLKLAGGRVWTGRQAKQNGLIDELGTLEDAIAEAARRGGLPEGKEPELLLLPKSKGFLDNLLGNLGAAAMIPEVSAKVRAALPLLELRREPVWAISPFVVDVK
jgi:protease-4